MHANVCIIQFYRYKYFGAVVIWLSNWQYQRGNPIWRKTGKYNGQKGEQKDNVRRNTTQGN